MKTTDIKDDPLFLDMTRQARKGALAHELGEALRELVKMVEDRNSAGTLTVVFKVRPLGSGQVVIDDDYKVKEPKALTGGQAVWYVDTEHNLRRDDPQQPNLPFVQGDSHRATA